VSTTYTGGLRARLIIDSVWYELERILTALGWFDSGRQHLPIQMIDEDPTDRDKVDFNTLALVPSHIRDEEIELGSILSDHERTFYIDFYAENQSVGEHLIYDLKDALQGRMATINRGQPTVTVMDYSLATPVQAFIVEIDDVNVQRAHTYSYPWQKFWYSIQFVTIDTYDGEDPLSD